MGNLNNIPSSVKVNLFIKDFINKHPENVVIWKDGDKTTIQLSNIGIRDKNMKYASYIANNTLEEENFTLFGLPCKCVYASDNILRFEGKTTDVVEAVTKPVDITKIPSYMLRENNSGSGSSGPQVNPPTVTDPSLSKQLLSNLPFVKPLVNRILTNKIIKKEIKRIDEDKKNNTITVYVIGKPASHDGDGNPYVTWEVINIIHIEAGTTWADPDFRDKLYEIKENAGIPSDSGSYGSFNVNFNAGTMAKDEDDHGDPCDDPNFKIISETEPKITYQLTPEFKFDSSIKVGDIIDTRDYHSNDIWPDEDYQTSSFDYQRLDNIRDNVPPCLIKYPENIERMKLGDSMIPDGAVVTI